MTSPRLIGRRQFTGLPVAEMPGEEMGSPTAASEAPRQPGDAMWRAGGEARLSALVPFFITAATYLVAPEYFARLFEEPPSVVGFPLGIALQLVTLGWAALGAAVVWQTRFRVMAAVALAACTGPAAALIVFGPPLVEIIQSLG